MDTSCYVDAYIDSAILQSKIPSKDTGVHHGGNSYAKMSSPLKIFVICCTMASCHLLWLLIVAVKKGRKKFKNNDEKNIKSKNIYLNLNGDEILDDHPKIMGLNNLDNSNIFHTKSASITSNEINAVYTFSGKNDCLHKADNCNDLNENSENLGGNNEFGLPEVKEVPNYFKGENFISTVNKPILCANKYRKKNFNKIQLASRHMLVNDINCNHKSISQGCSSTSEPECATTYTNTFRTVNCNLVLLNKNNLNRSVDNMKMGNINSCRKIAHIPLSNNCRSIRHNDIENDYNKRKTFVKSNIRNKQNLLNILNIMKSRNEVSLDHNEKLIYLKKEKHYRKGQYFDSSHLSGVPVFPANVANNVPRQTDNGQTDIKGVCTTVSNTGSSLNPNAPEFVPMNFRKKMSPATLKSYTLSHCLMTQKYNNTHKNESSITRQNIPLLFVDRSTNGDLNLLERCHHIYYYDESSHYNNSSNTLQICNDAANHGRFLLLCNKNSNNNSLYVIPVNWQFHGLQKIVLCTN